MPFPVDERTRVKINISRREQKRYRLLQELRDVQVLLAEDEAELARLDLEKLKRSYAADPIPEPESEPEPDVQVPA